MKRERATALIAELLERVIAGGTWQLDIVQAVYLFGSYARGSIDPGDVDLAVDIDRDCPEWRSHFLHALSYGRDPYATLRVAVRGRGRAVSLVFEREQHDHIEMMRIWQRGESFDLAMSRVRVIRADSSAARAPRDAMLPAFEGMEGWIPLYLRQELVALVGSNTIEIGRVALPDDDPDARSARRVLDERWTATSPLRRSAAAILCHWEKRGIDLAAVHLHGQDLDPIAGITPYFAGLGMRYFKAARLCFTDHGCVEWIEVVRPTRRGTLQGLVLQPGQAFDSAGWPWSADSVFR